MQVEKSMLQGQPWLQNFFTVSGNSLLDGLNLPNRAMIDRVAQALSPSVPAAQMTAVFAVLETAEQCRVRPQMAVANIYRLQPAADRGAGQFLGLRVRGPERWPVPRRPNWPPWRAGS